MTKKTSALNNKNTSWSGRFNEPVAELVKKYTASVSFDQRLATFDIQGSVAHAQMLGAQNIISQNDVRSIEAGLDEILQEIECGQFEWLLDLEDVHLNIEKRLHTGRSRNDQVATDVRLWLRATTDEVIVSLKALQISLLDLAEAHFDTVMPGFTHLQVAQPVTFGHHLMAYVEMLTRDTSRFLDCRKRINKLPLGAAALAGTSYPIDRELVAKKLGFDGVCENSLDAVSDRDFAIEFTFSASLVHLTALLTLMKGQPLAYNKDNQEDKEPLFDTADTLLVTLQIYADMLRLPVIENGVVVKKGFMVNKDNMRQAAFEGYATATDLADYLAKKGMPFRDAHEAVALAVRYAVDKKMNLSDLPLSILQTFAVEISDDVYAVLTLEGSLNSRNHIGGTAPEQVKAAIARARKSII